MTWKAELEAVLPEMQEVSEEQSPQRVTQGMLAAQERQLERMRAKDRETEMAARAVRS